MLDRQDDITSFWTWPEKQRRAPVETDPPRDIRLRVIAADEGRECARMPLPAFSSISDRKISHALKNSCDLLPRSGLHILARQLCLELDRRQIAQRRVQPLLVIDLLEELGDRGAGIGQIPILVA